MIRGKGVFMITDFQLDSINDIVIKAMDFLSKMYQSNFKDMIIYF